MTLSTLLFAILIISAFLLKAEKSKRIYMCALGLIGILSCWTISRYVNPDFEIYSNADYHNLQALGIQFEDSLYLANEYFPEMAMLNSKKGQLILRRHPDSAKKLELRTYNFHEPIFTESSHQAGAFDLGNTGIGLDISKGFELGIWNDSLNIEVPWLKLEIKEKQSSQAEWGNKMKGLLGKSKPGLRDSCTYRITYFRESDSLVYNSRFSRRLNIGLELRSILRNTYRVDLSDTLLSLIEDSYLLRNSFYRDRKEVNLSPLRLFPGENMSQTPGLYFKDFEGNKLLSEDFQQSHFIRLGESQHFFLGLGGTRATDAYKVSREGARISLFHEFPLRRKLRSDGPRDSEQHLFISSSTLEILQNDYDAGYHFPKFEADEHFLHFNGVFKYFLGEADDSLSFSVLDQFRNTIEPLPDTYLAGDTIYLSTTGFREFSYNKAGEKRTAIDLKEEKGYRYLRTSMGETDSIALKVLRTSSSLSPEISVKTPQWMFRFNDLRASNPIQTSHIFGMVFWIALLSFILILIKKEQEISKAEILIYGLLMGFMTVRMLLLWRSATFLPLEDIDLKIFSKLRSPVYFRDTYMAIGFFFVAIITQYLIFQTWVERIPLAQKIKNFSFFQHAPLEEEAPLRIWWEKYKVWLIAFAANWTFIFCTELFFPERLERFTNIAFPVLGFFLLSIPLFKYWTENKGQNQASLLENNLFWLGLLNGSSTWIWLLMKDAGFSIVFLLFGALSLGFGLGISAVKGNRVSWKRGIATLLVFFSIGLSIFYSTYLIDILIDKAAISFWIGIFTALLFLSYLGYKAYGFRVKYPQSSKIAGISLIALSTCLLALGSLVASGIMENPGKKVSEEYTYIKYRASIHNKSLEEISSEISFESYQSRKLLEASQNQWFIDQLLQKDSDKYFTLRPHFNKGASYISQTTDLVILRYIIAEHSQLTVLGLVLLFGFLFAGIIYRYNIFSGSNLALAGIPLLLGIQGFFIWMTVSNRFAFFGQDFPLISMQSRMTLFFTLSLLLTLIFFLKEESAGRFASKRPNENFLRVKNWLLLLIFICIAPVLAKGGKRNKGDENIHRFTLGKTLENTQSKMNKLNVDFQTFQRRANIQAPDSLIKAFEIWASEKGIPSYAEVKNRQGDDEFTLSVWDHFVQQSAKDKLDDPQQILHLRRPESQYYEFAVNNNYYLLRAPEELEKRWKGSLLSGNTGNTHEIIYRNQTDRPSVQVDNRNLRNNIFQKAGLRDSDSDLSYLNEDINNISIASFPASWTFDGKPLVLISIESGDLNSNKGNFSIVNDQFRISSKNNPSRSFAYRLESKDYINLYDHQENPVQLKMVSSENRYLAKNLWLNGKQELLFPLGSKSIWSYNYANLLSQTLSRDEKLRDSSVHVSIDYSLSEELYEIVEAYMQKHGDTDMSMVTMDHRGRIRSMIDYKKDPDSRFNPNNTREYSELFQKFYLESDRGSERTIFGNRCLQRLDNGPGSSIKPIMYTAVTSGVNINPWESMEFVWPNRKDELEANLKSPYVKRYAGHRMQGRWRLGPQDLDKSYNNISYLSKSSNLYHSLIMFLGSYRKDDLMALRGKSQIKPGKLGHILLPISPELEHNFPRIKFGKNGREYVFNPDKQYWPQASSGGIMSDLNSVLSNGLSENFDFQVQKPIDQSRMKDANFSPQMIQQEELLNSRSSYQIWSYPEMSHFYQIDRSGDLFDINGIRQSTVGGFPIEVTPLKMAEMGARMASLNRNINATLDTAGTLSFQAINYDQESWENFDKYLRFHADNTMQGLEEVLLSGTARAYKQLTKRKKGQERLYYYAKTGTIKGEKTKFDDRHLMLIISKEDLNDPYREIEDADSQPLFVIYISYFNSRGNNAALNQKLIRAVEKSGVFRYQMQHIK
ncbi:MAG: hypothetical protein R8P61_06710 [Bacteroidia bacterium]|nr:hypothetical protein [Bacteroidia bacterium]